MRLMKISIDPLEGKLSIVRKRTEKARKIKLGELWLVKVRNELRQLGEFGRDEGLGIRI